MLRPECVALRRAPSPPPSLPPFPPLTLTLLSLSPSPSLDYIWDGDELSAADLKLPDIETAQYSCHVVGLVLHAASRTLYLCDPNGALVPGGNMEFLALPFAPRGAKPSTAVSQYDLQQRSAAAAAAAAAAAPRATKKARKG